MKKFATAVVVMVLLCMAMTVTAQLPTSLPMVTGPDAMRNYALGIVKSGSRYVSSPSMNWNWSESFTYTNVSAGYAEKVLDGLFSTEFRYRLLNTNDLINGHVWLYDAPGSLIFYGRADYTLADLNNGSPQYNIWLQGIPLPVTNVYSATILALDADGRTANQSSLSVDHTGRPIFNWGAGCSNGVLAIILNDGTAASYSLYDPAAMGTTTSVEQQVAWKIEGHYPVKTTPGMTNTVKIIEIWNRPTVLLEVATNTPSTLVIVDVVGLIQENGTSFERPYALEFTPIEGGEPYELPLNTTKPSLVEFPSGTCRLVFKWRKFGQPGLLYTGPYGKG